MGTATSAKGSKIRMYFVNESRKTMRVAFGPKIVGNPRIVGKNHIPVIGLFHLPLVPSLTSLTSL